jgi:hypothetical protein
MDNCEKIETGFNGKRTRRYFNNERGQPEIRDWAFTPLQVGLNN